MPRRCALERTVFDVIVVGGVGDRGSEGKLIRGNSGCADQGDYGDYCDLGNLNKRSLFVIRVFSNDQGKRYDIAGDRHNEISDRWQRRFFRPGIWIYGPNKNCDVTVVSVKIMMKGIVVDPALKILLAVVLIEAVVSNLTRHDCTGVFALVAVLELRSKCYSPPPPCCYECAVMTVVQLGIILPQWLLRRKICAFFRTCVVFWVWMQFLKTQENKIWVVLDAVV